MHKNWQKVDFLGKLKALAERRNLKDLSIGPVLTWNNQRIKEHMDEILELEGSYILWGGKPLKDH